MRYQQRRDLGLVGGKQDHYAAAFGGANFIEFLPGDRVIVNPLRVSNGARNEFEASLVICFTGRSRDAAEIIGEQTAGAVGHRATTIAAFDRLKADAVEMKTRLLSGNMRAIAELLQDSWAAKKRTSSRISNARIEELHDIARANGALAGKVSGAGGGGFMMFIVDPEDRLQLVDALNAAGGRATPVKFSDGGCETWQVRR
jgi:D-glycero-alpha-D-manno-heptose-7-phosphate kinase